MEEEHNAGDERNPNSPDDLRRIIELRNINLLLSEIKDMKTTISTLKEDLEEALQRQIGLKAKFEEYAGECLERLQNEQGFALQLLEDSSAPLRWAAIYALRVHWLSTITEQIAIILVNMSEFDKDSEVRWQAIFAIGSYYKETKNQNICDILQRIIFKESEVDDNKERAKASIWLIDCGKFSA